MPKLFHSEKFVWSHHIEPPGFLKIWSSESYFLTNGFLMIKRVYDLKTQHCLRKLTRFKRFKKHLAANSASSKANLKSYWKS